MTKVEESIGERLWDLSNYCKENNKEFPTYRWHTLVNAAGTTESFEEYLALIGPLTDKEQA